MTKKYAASINHWLSVDAAVLGLTAPLEPSTTAAVFCEGVGDLTTRHVRTRFVKVFSARILMGSAEQSEKQTL